MGHNDGNDGEGMPLRELLAAMGVSVGCAHEAQLNRVALLLLAVALRQGGHLSVTTAELEAAAQAVLAIDKSDGSVVRVRAIGREQAAAEMATATPDGASRH